MDNRKYMEYIKLIFIQTYESVWKREEKYLEHQRSVKETTLHGAVSCTDVYDALV